LSTQSGVSLVFHDGQLHFTAGSAAWNARAEGVVVGRWHHVTVTWSATAGLYVYIDGRLAAGAGRCDVR